jgi:sugar phosphate isomerase/epimerase
MNVMVLSRRGLIALTLIAVSFLAGVAVGGHRRRGSCPTEEANTLGVRIFNYRHSEEDAWKHLPSIGVNHVFLGIPAPGQSEALKQKLAAHHLTAPVMRGNGEFTKPACVDVLGVQIETAAKLGAKYIFLSLQHPGVDKPTVYGWLRKAGEIARRHGITLVLETHPDLGTNADVQLETMRAVNHPNVRVNFDTGNITFYNKGRDAVTELKKILPYVATLEIKDHTGEFGVWDFPRLGTGKVDIPGVLKVIRQSGFRGPITLEIEGRKVGDVIYPNTKPEIERNIAESVKYIRSLGQFD